MVIIVKERSKWSKFDASAALVIWRKQKNRKSSFPPYPDILFDPAKTSIKTFSVIKQAHEERLKVWQKKWVSSENDSLEIPEIVSDEELDVKEIPEIVNDQELDLQEDDLNKKVDVEEEDEDEVLIDEDKVLYPIMT